MSKAIGMVEYKTTAAGVTAADLSLQGKDSVFLFPFQRLPQYK